ncbi:UvrD-helicase domain-containing protein [Streptomyces boluensis]|uniref:DNA 3'-5' helicase n=1 Tax=Streptomyces boluensis TaxID=1775135 RepID=A0A964UVJ5_9ACTN|nr:UvrD-helicase domain-containing protein [Streptomyces boluensis]NBE52425.1 UvrD-helicase domain-containing protein [Streptomyces boluensis]
MPRLALSLDFFSQIAKLQGSVRQGVQAAWAKFDRLTLDELFKDPGLKLESLKNARDPRIRTIRIDRGIRGVVLAPDSGDTFVLLRVLPHDKAIDWAVKRKATVNAVTGAVELRDITTLEALTPAYETLAPAPEQRLFAQHSDSDLNALGIDTTTLRQARVLSDAEQLEVFAPSFPEDQREVLEYLAMGFTVEDVWRDVVAPRLSAAATPARPVDTDDFDTAIRRTGTRVALVTGPEELRDILEQPFAAWRIFLHPAQRKVAYRPSYSGPAQVTGGPGTGKTVVALHRVRHLLGGLREGDRILLTTFTNALVGSLRSGIEALVDDPSLRERVDIMTVDAFARKVVDQAPDVTPRSLLTYNQQAANRWNAAAEAVGLPGAGAFLAQEYKHVVLAQDLTSLREYEAAPRPGRGSRVTPGIKPLVWQAVEHFTAGLKRDGVVTYLQLAAEAARRLDGTEQQLDGTGQQLDGTGQRLDGAERRPYRHIVVDEAQDLHPAQWRLLRAAVPEGPDDLFIAGDPHQRIYDSKVSLKALGIKVSGRSTKMRRNYRSTQQILRWSAALLAGRPIAELEDENRTDSLLGYRSALHGHRPHVYAAADERDEFEAAVAQIQSWTALGVLPEEIGISTRFHKTCEALIEHLTAAGIASVPLTSKATRPKPGVRVGTMHAFKGLEFRCVAVLGVHDEALPLDSAITPAAMDSVQHAADLLAERCLLFVACTRARDGLHVSWHGRPSPFLTDAGVGVE